MVKAMAKDSGIHHPKDLLLLQKIYHQSQIIRPITKVVLKCSLSTFIIKPVNESIAKTNERLI